jgi:uncharacterized integral membrane protein
VISPEDAPPPVDEPSNAATPATSGVARTRISATFIALIAALIVLVLLLVFILENTKRVKVSFFGASGHLPLGVALLLAAVAGALVLAISGAARVLQLRRGVRKRR